MKIDVFGISDLGLRRERNEDSYLINEELSLFVVADGMGGHLGGEYASKLAVKTIEEVMSEIIGNSISDPSKEGGLSRNDFKANIRQSIQTASNRIFDEARKNSSLRGMGTTAVVLAVHGDRVFIANVGDSRGYLIRDGKITQLTIDHSLVGEQLRAGVISEHAAKEHKLKNIITRSVGFQEDVDTDVVVKVPKEGDRYLLCSDGLTNMVDDDEILEVIEGNNPEEACQILVDMANARGGEDNITLILTKLMEVGDIGDEDEDEVGDEDESTIGI